MSSNLGREQLFHRILIFFAVFTAFVGLVNMASSDEITLEDMSAISGGTIPGQVVVDTSQFSSTGATTTVTGINLTSGVDYSRAYTTYGYGTWENSSSGLKLVSVGILNGVAAFDPAVALNHVIPDSGTTDTYTVSYIIDNVPNKEFYIYPRYVYNVIYDDRSSVRIRFASDGIHLQYYNSAYWADDYFLESADAQQTIPGGSTITTVFTDSTTENDDDNPQESEYKSNLQVCKDGFCYFYIDVWSAQNTRYYSSFRHAAAASDDTGFIVKGFPDTTVTMTSSSDEVGLTGISWLDAIIGGVSTIINVVSAFFGSLGAILGLEQDALIPFWIWAIVAIPCIVTLGYMFVETLTEAIP